MQYDSRTNLILCSKFQINVICELVWVAVRAVDNVLGSKTI